MRSCRYKGWVVVRTLYDYAGQDRVYARKITSVDVTQAAHL